MMRRTPLDRYIRRATLGLPRTSRVDVSAEMRVHLNARVRELEEQGFARDEAQHLAVQEMGPVADVHRKLLSHFFSSGLGWGLVAALLAGGGWWVWDTQFTGRTLELNLMNPEPRSDVGANYEGWVLEYTLTTPRDAKTITFSVSRDREMAATIGQTGFTYSLNTPKQNRAHTFKVKAGVYRGAVQGCNTQLYARVSVLSRDLDRPISPMTVCLSADKSRGDWPQGYLDKLDWKPQVNEWFALTNFKGAKPDYDFRDYLNLNQSAQLAVYVDTVNSMTRDSLPLTTPRFSYQMKRGFESQIFPTFEHQTEIKKADRPKFEKRVQKATYSISSTGNGFLTFSFSRGWLTLPVSQTATPYLQKGKLFSEDLGNGNTVPATVDILPPARAKRIDVMATYGGQVMYSYSQPLEHKEKNWPSSAATLPFAYHLILGADVSGSKLYKQVGEKCPEWMGVSLEGRSSYSGVFESMPTPAGVWNNGSKEGLFYKSLCSPLPPYQPRKKLGSPPRAYLMPFVKTGPTLETWTPVWAHIPLHPRKNTSGETDWWPDADPHKWLNVMVRLSSDARPPRLKAEKIPAFKPVTWNGDNPIVLERSN